MTPNFPDPRHSGDADARVGVVEAEVDGRLDVGQEDGEAADGGDGRGPHAGVGVAHVLVEDVHHQEANVRVLCRGLDNKITNCSLQQSNKLSNLVSKQKVPCLALKLFSA